MTVLLALFVFFSAAGTANRLDAKHHAKFNQKHRAWILKNYPGAK